MDVTKLLTRPSDETESSSTEASSERTRSQLVPIGYMDGINPHDVAQDLLTRFETEMGNLRCVHPDNVDYMLANKRDFQLRFRMRVSDMTPANGFKLSGKTGWTFFPKQQNGDCLTRASVTYGPPGFAKQFPNTTCMGAFMRVVNNESSEDLETWTQPEDCLIVVDMMKPHGAVVFREKGVHFCGKLLTLHNAQSVRNSTTRKRPREDEEHESGSEGSALVEYDELTLARSGPKAHKRLYMQRLHKRLEEGVKAKRAYAELSVACTARDKIVDGLLRDRQVEEKKAKKAYADLLPEFHAACTARDKAISELNQIKELLEQKLAQVTPCQP